MSWRKPPVAKSPHAWAAKLPTAKHQLSEIDRMYDRMPWRRCAASVKSCNPRCQLIVDGEQCHAAATEVHHLISPYTALGLFLDWQNLVALCHDHHKTTPGEDLANPNRYVTTHGLFGATVEPNEIIRRLQVGEPPFPR